MKGFFVAMPYAVIEVLAGWKNNPGNLLLNGAPNAST
jgi:hypothetical protein